LTLRHFTYREYKDWNPGEVGRYEIIYGAAYAMTGANTSHQTMLMELAKQIAVFLTGKPCRVLPAPYDVRLFYEEDESDGTVVEPGIIFENRRILSRFYGPEENAPWKSSRAWRSSWGRSPRNRKSYCLLSLTGKKAVGCGIPVPCTYPERYRSAF
jgi:hypothetical protein